MRPHPASPKGKERDERKTSHLFPFSIPSLPFLSSIFPFSFFHLFFFSLPSFPSLSPIFPIYFSHSSHISLPFLPYFSPITSQKPFCHLSKTLLVALKNTFDSRHAPMTGCPLHRQMPPVAPSNAARCIVKCRPLHHQYLPVTSFKPKSADVCGLPADIFRLLVVHLRIIRLTAVPILLFVILRPANS